MSETLKRLPVGVVSFKELREQDCLYVDKTEIIYRLTQQHPFALLMRPRRFGKSLLLSTLHSLFSAGLRDFAGLKIERLWQEETCKVLSLDLSGINCSTPSGLRQSLCVQIIRSARLAGLDTSSFPPDDPTLCLDLFALNALPQKLAILVDEYDAPARSPLSEPELQKKLIEELKNFFSAVKRLSVQCRMILFTGVTRTTLTDEYSCLNFLTDISLFPEYSTLLGYTEEELTEAFAPYIKALEDFHHLTPAVIREKIRYYYDGYSFDGFARSHVYNSWSILNLLSNPFRGFYNYWYVSGQLSQSLTGYFMRLSHTGAGPQFSQMLAFLRRSCAISMEDLSYPPHLNDTAAQVLLFRLGYLTIKEGIYLRRELNQDTLTLTLPNLEIESSLARLFSELSAKENASGISLMVKELPQYLEDYAHPEKLAHYLELLYNTFSYDTKIYASEALLRDTMFLFCKMNLLHVSRETPSARGRSDLEVETDTARLIFEFKVAHTSSDADKKLAEAAEQIKERAYGRVLPEKTLRYYAVILDARAKQVARISVFNEDELPLGYYSAQLT
ncbi:MAG TPA: AAA family ATPase [Candidatus Avisuccinivibrio pullicola]|nr:AAA family ATPase [Candidatus Avisuccinivibrio pullicola]